MRANWRMLGILIVIASVGLAVSPARAEGVDFDVRGGFYVDDADGPFVGAGVLGSMGSSGHWFFNPNVEAAFGDHVDVITLNGDFHYDLPTRSSLAMWVGGGPAIVNYDADPGFGRDDDETDLGFNGIFGLGARRGDVRPFFQVKVLVSDESELVVGGGIRF